MNVCDRETDDDDDTKTTDRRGTTSCCHTGRNQRAAKQQCEVQPIIPLSNNAEKQNNVCVQILEVRKTGRLVPGQGHTFLQTVFVCDVLSRCLAGPSSLSLILRLPTFA